MIGSAPSNSPGPAEAGFFSGARSASVVLSGGPKVTQTENGENPRPKRAPDGAPGAYGVIEYRSWCAEYRVRTETDAGPTPPPVQMGRRESDQLTERAAMKLAESGRYVASCHGGYQTFLTLTFDDPARARIDAGEITIQREVSRFFNAARMMRARGWTTSKGRRVPGAGAPLLYCWVAENPTNAEGERNPHVHVLMNWRVPAWLFKDWAARMEGLWRQGFAHLEKIRDEQAATAYMLKAVGYLAKAADDKDQGPIKGNRYAISEGAHAPPWITIERRELRALGALIADVADHCKTVYAEAEARRMALQAAVDRNRDRRASDRRAGREPTKNARRIGEILRRRLNAARRERKERPIIANRYRIIVRGIDNAAEFAAWVDTPHEYRPGVDWLPPKEAGQHWHKTAAPPSADVARMREAIQWRRQCREAARRAWHEDEWLGLLGAYADEAAQQAARDDVQSELHTLALYGQISPSFTSEGEAWQKR